MATTNLNLPQWELSDPILMEQFNNAFQSIDQFAGIINQAVAACSQITLLATGLNDSSGVYLTESAYNFRFLVFEVGVGRNILVPMFDKQTAVFGSLSEFTAEAYDTYMFVAAVSSGGTILGDNRNAKVTTWLRNPAQTTYNTFTVTNIYGICRISS